MAEWPRSGAARRPLGVGRDGAGGGTREAGAIPRRDRQRQHRPVAIFVATARNRAGSDSRWGRCSLGVRSPPRERRASRRRRAYHGRRRRGPNGRRGHGQPAAGGEQTGPGGAHRTMTSAERGSLAARSGEPRRCGEVMRQPNPARSRAAIGTNGAPARRTPSRIGDSSAGLDSRSGRCSLGIRSPPRERAGTAPACRGPPASPAEANWPPGSWPTAPSGSRRRSRGELGDPGRVVAR
jgi:hypothetical protein